MIFHLQVESNTRELTKYNKTYAFSATGKIGAGLSKLLEVELSTKDTVNVEAKFGDIVKNEIDQPKLLDILKEK